jgi:hypothetical protein
MSKRHKIGDSEEFFPVLVHTIRELFISAERAHQVKIRDVALIGCFPKILDDGSASNIGVSMITFRASSKVWRWLFCFRISHGWALITAILPAITFYRYQVDDPL